MTKLLFRRSHKWAHCIRAMPPNCLTRTPAPLQAPSRARALASTSPRVAPDRFSSMLVRKATSLAARIEVHRQGEATAVPMARLDIKVRDRLGAVEFLEIDHSGRMFLFAENIPVSGGTAGAFVARIHLPGCCRAFTNCR